MKKILIAAVIIALSSGLVWKISKNDLKKTGSPSALTVPDQSPIQSKIDDEAFKNALNAYAKAKQEGTNLLNGPCLGIVAPDWVADIAHKPRQAVDDKEENQCEEFRSGQAKHFIELDPDGKLIRAK